MTTAADVAAYMQQRLNAEQTLYQETAVYEVQAQFGDDFVRTSEQTGGLLFTEEVLKAFRKINADSVVWSLSGKYWRFRQPDDGPKRNTPYY